MHDDQRHLETATMLAANPFVGAATLASTDPLPGIPTMIVTRLQLQLLLQETLLDLKAVSSVILADAGATLQVLRLIGEEYPDAEGRPTRIEDCIVSLNKERLYEVVCASGVSHSGPLVAEWQHCRLVAEHARELAKCIDGVSPEEAYLVGLLYRLGSFPHLMGWNSDGDSSGEQRALGLMLADYWHLPDYLLSAIKDQQEALYSSPWSELLQTAHRMADQATQQEFSAAMSESLKNDLD